MHSRVRPVPADFETALARGWEMPLIPGMRHDVFVSYAHLDNIPYSQDSRGWVSTVVHCIKMPVQQLEFGDTRFDIWMDHQRPDTGRLDEQLVNIVAASGILLVFLSRAYLRSKTCLFEFDAFMAANPDDFHERIVIIDMHNVFSSSEFVDDMDGISSEHRSMLDRVVAECRRQRRQQFFSGDDSGRVCPLDYPPKGPEPYEIMRKTQDVSPIIAKVIRTLRRARQDTIIDTVRPLTPTGTFHKPNEKERAPLSVMIGLTKDVLRENRDSVVRYLSGRQDLKLLPHSVNWLWPDSRSIETFRERFASELTAADLFVQLIGNPRTARPPIESRLTLAVTPMPSEIIKIQIEEAERLKKQHLIWCSPNTPTRHLDPIERDIDQTRSVMRDSIETLKRQLDIQIQHALRARDIKTAYSAPLDLKKIFFNFSSEDRDLVEPTVNSLSSQYTAFAPLCEGTLRDIQEQTNDFYRDCDAAILFGHHAPPNWTTAQIIQFLRVQATRDKKICMLAVCKPKSRLPPAVRSPNLNLQFIDTEESIEPDSLVPLVTSAIEAFV